MTKQREFDCGTWNANAPDGYNRITVRERPDGLYEIVHVRYVHTASGLVKTESPYAIYRDLAQAKEAAWTIWRELQGVGRG